MDYRNNLKNKQKIVIKIGSSSIIHQKTGGVDFRKIVRLVRIICELSSKIKDVQPSDIVI